MLELTQAYVHHRARHMRYMFFVAEIDTENYLRNLFEANQRLWGGRYNPIVPVIGGIINDIWLTLVEPFDPDVIYYSSKVDLNYLLSLNKWFPKEYIQLHDEGRNNFPGVDIHCLLHSNIQGDFDGPPTLMHSVGLYSTALLGKDFYSLNLGLGDLYLGQDKYINEFQNIIVDKDNPPLINKFIYDNKIFFKSLLSKAFINTTIHRSLGVWSLTNFEMIVYYPDHYFDDLLYFWNRQLYIQPSSKHLHQVIISLPELEELLTSDYFEGLIAALDSSWKPHVCSRSLSEDQLEEVRKKLQEKCKRISIGSYKISEFPFTSTDHSKHRTDRLREHKTLISNGKGFLVFPEINLSGRSTYFKGNYCQDLVIERDTESRNKLIKFPYNTHLHFLLSKTDSRINKYHNATFFVNDDLSGIDIEIPTDQTIFKSLFSFQIRQTNFVTIPLDHTFLSPAGQKLSAFTRLFKDNWNTIETYIQDKFWLDVFRSHSDIKGSNIKSSKGTFSFKDIIEERRAIYSRFKNHIISKKYGRLALKPDSDEAGKILHSLLEEDEKYHLKPEIQHLINSGALFIGMKVKCNNCGSKKWYSLGELNDKVICKGCHGESIPQMESPLYYRINDVMINNLVSDETNDKAEFDGNYVVLNVLNALQRDSVSCRGSFIWSAPMEIIISGKHPRATDIDIVAIQGGKLILGEAKVNASQFGRKDITNLIWIGKNLSPDIIVLAYSTGKIGDQVNQVKEGINRSDCEVIPFKTSDPWHSFGGLFGLK